MSAVLKEATRGQDLALVTTNADNLDDSSFQAIIVVDAEMAPDVKARVVGLATRAHLHLADMHKNAAAFCITVHQCREAHGPDGWGDFTKANFPQLGASNLRNAVRAGKLLVEQISGAGNEKNQKLRLEKLSRLSRNALFALADATPETIERVDGHLDENGKKPPTAAQITQWSQSAQLARDEAEIEMANLRAQAGELAEILKQAQDDLRIKESMRMKLERQVSEQAELIKAAGDTVLELRKGKAEAEKAARTPVEAIVHALPPGVKSEAEALKKIQKEVAEATARRNKLVDQANETARKLSDINVTFQAHKQSADIVTKIRNDVNRLVAEFSPELLSSLKSNTPITKNALKEIASHLRAFADRLSPLE